MIDWFATLIAAALGWSLARGALCAVAATQQAVVEQKAAGLYLQLTATAVTGVTLLGLSLWIGDIGRLPGDAGTRLTIIVGAVVLALGALLNGGCYLGSIMYLGRGKTNFLFTLAGIAVAARCNLAAVLGLSAHPSLRPQPNNPTLWAAIGVFAVLVGLAVFGIRREAGRSLDSRTGYTVLAGVLAAALMIHMPGWNYATLLNGIAALPAKPLDLTQVVPAIALFVGAVASCIAAGTWQPSAPTGIGMLRCLAGGFVMESAARCIPGGNDVLLFWAMPGLGAYGLLAYSLILSTMLLLFTGAARWRPQH
jgi:toxin CptA